MAAPNVNASSTTITLKSLRSTVGTSAVTLVTCAADKAVKISAIYAANIDGSNAADVSARVNVSGTTHAVCSTVSVPADASLVIVDRNAPVYLDEGQSLEVLASSTGTLHIVGSYEEIA